MEAVARFLATGYGSGDGSGTGYGYGSGDGSGTGYGSGSGDGSGDGTGIRFLNGNPIHIVDGVPTIIKSIHGSVATGPESIAKGFIVQADLTLKRCFIVKVGNSFAHGGSIKEAHEDAESKAFEEMDEDERIASFLEQFSLIESHLGADLFEWHGKLTGSCLMGREQFVRDRQIDLTKRLTIAEFVALTKDAYGGEIVARLLEAPR